MRSQAGSILRTAKAINESIRGKGRNGEENEEKSNLKQQAATKKEEKGSCKKPWARKSRVGKKP